MPRVQVGDLKMLLDVRWICAVSAERLRSAGGSWCMGMCSGRPDTWSCWPPWWAQGCSWRCWCCLSSSSPLQVTHLLSSCATAPAQPQECTLIRTTCTESACVKAGGEGLDDGNLCRYTVHGARNHCDSVHHLLCAHVLCSRLCQVHSRVALPL